MTSPFRGDGGVQVLDSLIDGPLRLRNRREGDELIGMIVRYLRTGEEPEPRTDTQEAVLTAIRPVMETSRSRIVAGGNGGKSSSSDASKAESKTPSKSSSSDASKAESKRPSEEEEEEEVGRGIKEEGKAGAARFRAPSPEEVAEYASAYAASKGIDLASTDFDPERFVDFYAQKGWMVGKSRMKDWKASVRNWVRTSKPKHETRLEVTGGDDFSQYD